MNQTTKQVFNLITESFKTGKIASAIAMACFPQPEVPSANWSFVNRSIMLLSDTMDARGYYQWKSVNRFVKAGSRAVHILAPDLVKRKEPKNLKSFNPVPVFRFEDTDGENLERNNAGPQVLPLMKRATDWKISLNGRRNKIKHFRYCSQGQKEVQEMSAKDVLFFHALSFTAYQKISGEIKTKNDPVPGIVIDLCVASLCEMVGKYPKGLAGNSFQELEKFAGKIEKPPHHACLFVMSKTEKVLSLILK